MLDFALEFLQKCCKKIRVYRQEMKINLVDTYRLEKEKVIAKYKEYFKTDLHASAISHSIVYFRPIIY